MIICSYFFNLAFLSTDLKEKSPVRHAIRDIPICLWRFFFEMIDFPLPLVRPSINTEPDKVIQAEKAFCITQTRKKATQEAKKRKVTHERPVVLQCSGSYGRSGVNNSGNGEKKGGLFWFIWIINSFHYGFHLWIIRFDNWRSGWDESILRKWLLHF